MRYIIIILSLFLLQPVSIQAQEFEITYAPDYIETLYQSSKTYEITIKSFAEESKEIQLSLNQKLLVGGSKAEICLDNRCFTESITITLSPLLPSRTLRLNFTGGLTEINSNLLLIARDNNFKHEITKEINVKVTDFLASDLLFVSGQNKFNNLFPNPATSFAAMNYSCKSENAKIILQNVLGSIIEEFEIDPFEDRLIVHTDNLRPGIYFYTLIIDGDGLATKKLVVKK
ncbi:MAG: hypothetical protein ACJAT1_000940 [Marivirga sp.]